MDPFSGPEKMEKTVSHKVVLPCAVQCLLGSLDICFIELFWCQAIKIKLVTAKVWPKGGPKSGSVLRRQKWSCKNKYIIFAYDSGRAHFWGHETDPKVAPLFCPQSFAERCCDRCFFHWSARHGLQNASRHEKNCAVQCLLGSLDICFIELFWCQAIKIKLVTAKVWPKGGPKSGSVLRRQKWSCKNKYIIFAYDSGRAHFWGHETDPKVAPLFCPQSFAERCCDRCFFHWSARHGLQNASRHEKNYGGPVYGGRFRIRFPAPKIAP